MAELLSDDESDDKRQKSDELLQLHCYQCRYVFTAACPECQTPLQKTDAVWFSMNVPQRAQLFRHLVPEQAENRSSGKGTTTFTCKKASVIKVDVVVNAQKEVGTEEAFPSTGKGTATDTVSISAATPASENCMPPALNIGSVEHLTVEAVNVSLNLQVTQADLQYVSDARIKRAVEDIIVAKVNWEDCQVQKYREKFREEKKRGVETKAWFEREIKKKVQELQLEKEAIESEMKNIQKSGQKEMEALTGQLLKSIKMPRTKLSSSSEIRRPSEIIALLAEQHQRTELQLLELSDKLRRQEQEKAEELAALKRCSENEKKREQEKIMTFVLKLEERDQAVLRQAAVTMEKGRLLDVIKRLFEKHNIRLMGVDCGLSFLMEAPVSQWVEVVEKQLKVQQILTQLLPENVRQSVTSNIYRYYEYDVDIVLGKSLNSTHNPLTSKPFTRMLTCRPEAAEDKEKPWITSIVSNRRDVLVMTDMNNNKVKAMNLNSPDYMPAYLSLGQTPLRLALLNDDLVAMTTENKYIYILEVDNDIRVQATVKTIREYWGIAGNADDTLIVSCERDSDGSATIDIISRRGQVIKTLANTTTIKQLRWPYYLCNEGKQVLASDFLTDQVYRIELTTGRVKSSISDPSIVCPGQACTDKTCNIYFTCRDTKSVMMMSPNGHLCRLLTAFEDRDLGMYYPFGVCVTQSGNLVVAWCRYCPEDSLLVVYQPR